MKTIKYENTYRGVGKCHTPCPRDDNGKYCVIFAGSDYCIAECPYNKETSFANQTVKCSFNKDKIDIF